MPLPFLVRANVGVYFGLNVTTGVYTTKLVDGTDYTWTNDTSIRTTTAPAAGVTLSVMRTTPSSDLAVQWQNGSALVAEDLLTADRQNLYAVQEQQDRNELAISQFGASAAAAAASSASSASQATAAAAAAASSISASNAAISAANAVTITANAAASAANVAVQIATASAVPQSPLQIIEPLSVLLNAAFSVGQPGGVPFGVGPVLTPGAAFSGISQSDYYPIHHASGSFC